MASSAVQGFSDPFQSEYVNGASHYVDNVSDYGMAQVVCYLI